MGTFSALQFTTKVFLIRRRTRPLPRSAVAQIAEVEMTAKLNLGAAVECVASRCVCITLRLGNVLPDKQTVKCLGGGGNSVNSEMSPLCCCAEVMQMCRVFNEYLISR